MDKKIQYTVSIYTENSVGLLNRISTIFLKRHINIESFTTSECEIENVFRFIIVVEITQSGIEKVIDQNVELTFSNVLFSPEIYVPLIAFFIILFIAFIIRKFYWKQ